MLFTRVPRSTKETRFHREIIADNVSKRGILPGASGRTGRVQWLVVSAREHGEVTVRGHDFLQPRNYFVIRCADRFRQYFHHGNTETLQLEQETYDLIERTTLVIGISIHSAHTVEFF